MRAKSTNRESLSWRAQPAYRGTTTTEKPERLLFFSIDVFAITASLSSLAPAEQRVARLVLSDPRAFARLNSHRRVLDDDALGDRQAQQAGGIDKEVGGGLGGLFLVHALGPAAQDDAGGGQVPDLLEGDRAGVDFTVDLALAYPPRDELGVLRAEVEDEDRLTRHGSRN